VTPSLDVSDHDADRQPKLVAWIAGLYALSGVYVLFGSALFLLGAQDQSGELIAFFHAQSSTQLSLAVLNAAVSVGAAVALLRMSGMAFPLFFISWLLLTISSVWSWPLIAGPDARLTSVVKYAFASYALYYVFSVRHRHRVGHGYLRQQPSRSSANITSV
jgi:hypothetical protein